MAPIALYTIGFTEKSAETFFTLLQNAKILRVLDIRLKNVSQLAGYAKRDDLRYFLRQICNADYVHVPLLAPTEELLTGYRKGTFDWDQYRTSFLALLTGRKVQVHVSEALLDRACLLCSEHLPTHCHRSLVAEYLAAYYPLAVKHLC